MLSAQTDTLSRIESRLAKNHIFYASLSDGNEVSAMAFVSGHGGEEVVRKVSTETGSPVIRLFIIAVCRTTVFCNNWPKK